MNTQGVYPADGAGQGHYGQGPMGGMQGGLQGGMDMMGPPLGMGGVMGMGPPLGERVFPSVKLRGLPFDVTEDDIRMFLGCEPVDILMVRRDGRLSGEAFVVLASPMHVELALSKNRSYLGRRYIEVYRTKKADYYKAVVSEMMDGGQQHYGGGGGGYGMGGHHAGMGGYDHGYGYSGGMGGGGAPGMYGGGVGGVGPGAPGGDTAGTTILKLRGLPFAVQDEDIVRWFDDPSLGITPLTSDSVFIVQEHGRPNGIAFVELPTPQEASAAMAMNRKTMGSRYIEIFPANRSDLERYRARGNY